VTLPTSIGADGLLLAEGRAVADWALAGPSVIQKPLAYICMYQLMCCGCCLHAQMGEAATKIAPDLDGPPPPVNTLKPLARCSSSADLMVGQKVS
jgi:hypothetical protein